MGQFQNFESYPSDQTTDFTENNPAAFTIITQSAMDQAFRARIASSTSAAAAVTIVGSGGMDFNVSTDLTFSALTAADATSSTLSLAAVGTSTSFGASEYRVAMDFVTGTFLLFRNGTAVTYTSTLGTVPAFTLASTYALSLSATYSSPTAALVSVSLSNGASTFSATYADAAALTGTNFGYRIAKDGTGSALTTDLDNFRATIVPEPSSALLMIGSLAGFLGTRRRRTAR